MVDTGFPIIGLWQAIQLRWRYTKANASAPATFRGSKIADDGHGTIWIIRILAYRVVLPLEQMRRLAEMLE